VVIDNFVKLGAKEVICLHDECYGTFTSIASAYGMEVPFKPVYYMDFLLERMHQLKDRIVPLNIRAAYQRPCSNRLIPDKFPLVKEILDLIGVELPDRQYQGENCLCCGEILRAVSGYRLADDIQDRNLSDMVQTGATHCVFNCPACQSSLSEKVVKRGLKRSISSTCARWPSEKRKGRCNEMSDILSELKAIVGERGVTNTPEELWFYSRDPGVLEPPSPIMSWPQRLRRRFSGSSSWPTASASPSSPWVMACPSRGWSSPSRAGSSWT
jgi:Fe-S oxidoreductase